MKTIFRPLLFCLLVLGFAIVSDIRTDKHFSPHFMCFAGDSALIWLHVISNAGIALAYFIIPLFLFLKYRKLAVGNKNMGLAFGTFILACGMTHVMQILNIWSPEYWLSGAVQIITAIASLSTAYYVITLSSEAKGMT